MQVLLRIFQLEGNALIWFMFCSDFNFPPASAIAQNTTADDLKSRDLQLMEMEKHAILDLESKITKTTIIESSSQLLSQVMSLDPK